MNCQGLDPQLLVQLIRLKKMLTRSASISHRPKSPVHHSQHDDIDRQVDLSYPSASRAPQIDIEIIEMMLNTQGIEIEKKFNECTNEYFRRGMIQLKQLHRK